MLTCLAAFTGSAHAGDVGLKILNQESWTPFSDDEWVYTLVDDEAMVSRILGDVWVDHRDPFQVALTAALEVPDLIAPEVTLYGVWVELPEPTFTFARVGGVDDADLDATLVLDDVRADVHTSAPFYPEERCTIVLDLRSTIRVETRDSTTETLDIPAFRVYPATRIDDVRVVDEHGGPCESVADAAGLDAALTAGVSVDLGATWPFDPTAAFPPTESPARDLNRALYGYFPRAVDALSDAIFESFRLRLPLGAQVAPKVNAWFHDDQVVLAYGADVPADDGLRTGVVSGRFTSPTGTVSCEQIPIRVARKTGPRPIVGPEGELGEVPYEDLETSLACASIPEWSDADGVLHAAVTTVDLYGLPDHWPTLTFAGASTGCPAESAEYTDTFVRVDGIPPRILPDELALQREVTADAWDLPCGGWLAEPSLEDLAPHEDPLIDPETPSVPIDAAWWEVGWAYDPSVSATAIAIYPVTSYAYGFDFTFYGY